jgi:peptide/nickel transport system substrate-binding protein
MMHKKALAVSAAVALFLLAGCSAAGDSPDASASAHRGGSVTILGPDPTGGLDPAAAFVDSSRSPIAMMFQTLVLSDDSGKLSGGLAKSWTIGGGGTDYTFTLRPKLAFSDGSPITPEDVVYSVNRMRESLTLKGQLAHVQSVEAVGDDQVRIHLDQPYRALPAALSRAGQAVILPEAAVKANADFFTKPTVGSGPWTLSEYVPKDHMTFVMNKKYFDPAYIQKLVIVFAEDQTASAAAVQSGSADIANISYADAKTLKSVAGLKVEQVKEMATPSFGFDKKVAPFSDVRVRQAFAYAIDRTGVQKACWFGTGAVSYGAILLPSDPNYTKIDTYDLPHAEGLKKAAALLDEAGWVLVGGKRVSKGVPGLADGTPFEVTVPYESNWSAAECHTLVLQQDAKELGIQVTPKAYDPNTFYTDAAAGKFEMWHAGVGGQDADGIYLNMFHTGGSLTAVSTQLDDPEINALIDATLASTDAKTVKADYAKLERWQAENVPLLVDVYQFLQVAVSDKVHGYVPSTNPSISLGHAWVSN